MNELDKLINTLKKDNTNPLINKDVIIKAFEAARGELDGKTSLIEVSHDYDGFTTDEIENAKVGDIFNTEGYLTQLIYKAATEAVFIQFYMNDAATLELTVAVYNKVENDWSNTDNYDFVYPFATENDAGKVLTINHEGVPQWATPAAGGTKLYMHTIDCVDTPLKLMVLSPKATAFTNAELYSCLMGLFNDLSIKGTFFVQAIDKDTAGAMITNRFPNVGKLSPLAAFYDIAGPNFPGGSVTITLKSCTLSADLTSGVVSYMEFNAGTPQTSTSITDTVTEF